MQQLTPGWVALLCALCSGCLAYTGSAREVTPNLWQAERGWIAVDDVPLLKQRAEYDCGPTALAMVVGYWHPDSPAAPPASSSDRRFTAEQLRDRARALGLASEVVEGDLRDIKFELSNRRPVIVGVAKPTADGPVAHYLVVVAIHPDTQRIITLDPADGWRQNSYEGFLREWVPSGRLLLVVAGQRRPTAAGAPVAAAAAGR